MNRALERARASLSSSWHRRPRHPFAAALSALFLFLLSVATSAQPARGARGMVATVQPLATEAGVAALRHGGNAVDAAIAAALTLGIVDGHNSGLGGGCFLLLRLRSGEVVAIDGREKAPGAATRAMFLREGKADPRLSQTGALASGVPGALAAYDYAARHYGKLPLAVHLRAAAEVAARGFPLDRAYAGRLAATAEDLRRFPSSHAVYFKSDQSLPKAGESFMQPDLAKTYRSIAERGTDWFYRGPFARQTAAWMKDNGGLLSARDFAAYRPVLREPIRTRYRGCEVVGFPPPSSGGIHVAQILNILEHFDLRKLGAGSPELVHVVIEAMKLAFADRAYWLGDPDFARVPRGLVSEDYGAQLARRIDLEHASKVAGHDTPPQDSTELFGRHTTHFSAVDADGNWAAVTATLNTSFGSKVVVPGTGVVLNNQMDDFSIQPGVANAFGLVGADANAVAAGKRPLSSMSPTIVLREGRPVLALGAAGGPTIISQVLLTLIHVIDFGLPLDQALAQPRFHHQWQPDEVRIERRAGDAIVQELQRRGHRVVVVESIGAAQAVAFDPATRQFTGGADPRG
ncbi:MAG TPA: gamma-glutamyltransferase, partial [Candidatus Saccharimonadales bacterium]|nr:gamma-glutamyltransferase [Candidatus Saccharimonadales bacterium]